LKKVRQYHGQKNSMNTNPTKTSAYIVDFIAKFITMASTNMVELRPTGISFKIDLWGHFRFNGDIG